MAEFENHNRINELDNGLDKKQQSKKKYWDKKGVLDRETQKDSVEELEGLCDEILELLDGGDTFSFGSLEGNEQKNMRRPGWLGLGNGGYMKSSER